ncbi:Phosphatidylinositol N-acetylglucosaminyltransferase subunit Q [Seminavis robusta]|uniref:Phosphatidylinositol N-acetylglucosaminyltransferase subunit Q n=1 Tax=Seminavis robusta TaxID=568900 RepID=A0A9N8E6N0_9STRA|nr:Phosphatidylinositol N-acetylglucosaminyltransferase subunit Q [Seminavis robusta]|eukprot:Sro730_g194080.1 Phosphatidylinositol N-acetylglucosaminyltransferase subunit Q (606) ;mRNA; f:33605-35422
MEGASITDDWQGSKRRLLFWPDVNPPLGTEGFVLGWYWKQGSASNNWPTAATLVVAGIVGRKEDDGNEISQAHDNLQKRLGSLRETPKGLDSNSHVNELRIVGYLLASSGGDSEMSNATKEWLKQDNLLIFYLQQGTNYPTIQYEEQGCQIVLYDPHKTYHDNICSPESTFGKILAQVSMAQPILTCLAKTKEISDDNSKITATSDTTSDDNSLDRPDESGQRKEAPTGIIGSSLPVLRHSMMFSHLWGDSLWRSSPLTRLVWDSYNNMPREKRTNQRLADAMDLVAGILCGVVLVVWGQSSVSSMISSYFVEQPYLPAWLDWLESFPIGFKLNVAVTLAIGQEIRSLVLLRQAILSFLIDSMANDYTIGVSIGSYYNDVAILAICAVLGGTGCLALAMDMVALLTIHLALLAEGFRYVYRTEFYLLASSWRLFRGKKLNILRKRTDTMEYDSMQLLMGSMLFVASLFLLTTVLVYYTFFTILNLVVRTITTAVLWTIYSVIIDFPFGTCFLRLLYPGSYTARVLIQEEEAADTDSSPTGIVITRLQAIPESLGSILASQTNLTRRIRALKSWLGSVFSEILSGKPTAKSFVEHLQSTVTCNPGI